MTKDEALKIAIEAMEIWNGKSVKTNTASFRIDFEGVIQACKEALSQPAQEPVTKQYLVVDENDCHGDGSVYRGLRGKDSSIPTYRIETHPEPVKEPVTWMYVYGDDDDDDDATHPEPVKEYVLLNVQTHDEKTYKVEVSAPTKEWVGLSEEEINVLKLLQVSEAVIRAIEGTLKEKNT